MAFNKTKEVLDRGKQNLSDTATLSNYIKLLSVYQTVSFDKLLEALPEKLKGLSIDFSDNAKKEFLDMALRLDLIRESMEKAGLDTKELSNINKDFIENILAKQGEFTVEEATEIIQTLKVATDHLGKISETLEINLVDLKEKYNTIIKDERVDLQHKEKFTEEMNRYTSLAEEQIGSKRIAPRFVEETKEGEKKIFEVWENISETLANSEIMKAGKGVLASALFPFLGPWATNVTDIAGKFFNDTIKKTLTEVEEKREEQKAKDQITAIEKMVNKIDTQTKFIAKAKTDQDAELGEVISNTGEIADNTEEKKKKEVKPINEQFGDLFGDLKESFGGIKELFTKGGEKFTSFMADSLGKSFVPFFSQTILPMLTQLLTILAPALIIAIKIGLVGLAGMAGLAIGRIIDMAMTKIMNLIGKMIPDWGPLKSLKAAMSEESLGAAAGELLYGGGGEEKGEGMALERFKGRMTPEAFKMLQEGEGSVGDKFKKLKESGIITRKGEKWTALGEAEEMPTMGEMERAEEERTAGIMPLSTKVRGEMVMPEIEGFRPGEIAERARIMGAKKAEPGGETKVFVPTPPPVIPREIPPIGRQVGIDDPGLAIYQMKSMMTK